MYKTLLTTLLVIVYAVSNLYCQEQSIDSLQKLLKEQSTSKLGKTRLLNELSSTYHQKEMYPEAIYYKEMEANVYKELGIDSAVAFCNERLGVLYFHIGSYNTSSTYLIDALSYFEQSGSTAMVGQISTNLANLYTRLENHKRSITYLLKAESIFKDSPQATDRTLSGLYTNLGLAYSGSKQLDSAMFYYSKALALTNEEENPLYVASILNNVGEVEYERFENDSAMKHYEKSLALFESIDNHNGIGASMANIAKLNIRLGNYDQAIDQCIEALGHFKLINSLYFIVSTNEQLYQAYKGKGDFENALITMETYQQFNDSLMGAETTEHITNLEMQYATQKERQKFKLLEQEAQLIENELKLNQLYLYSSIAGIIVLLVLIVLVISSTRARLQRNKLKQSLLQQEQEKLKDNLFFKQKEIENFANYIQEKNKLLSDLKKEIKIISKNEAFEQTALGSLTNLVNQSLHIDNDRKELELKIDQSHQEFLHRLTSKFPKLTRTEKRLCSLLLLELSSKEIALIMNVETNSVKTSRNRLRKKLTLPANADIAAYLNKI